MTGGRAGASRALAGVLAAALIAAAPGAAGAQPAAGAPAGDDAATPDRLIRAFYESNSAGDWPRFRALFLPGARIVFVGRDAPGRGRWAARTAEEFVAERARSGVRVRERELARQEVRYGAVLHAWSAYELRTARGAGDAAGDSTAGADVTRGVNSFELARAEGRWRIAHLLWTNDRVAGPIPAEFLGPGGDSADAPAVASAPAPADRECAPEPARSIAAAAGAASPARDAARSARDARVLAELRALVAAANAALARRDRAALERLFAEEYVWAHAAGYVNDRATHLDEELAVDTVAPLRPAFGPPARLHVYGPGEGSVAVLRTPFSAAGGIAAGRTTLNSWTFVRQDGRWRIAQTQGTLLQPGRPRAPVGAAALDAYAGSYAEAGRPPVVVRRDGGCLVRRVAPSSAPPRVLVPAADSVFVDKLGTEYTFGRGPDGRAAWLVTRSAYGAETRRGRVP